jgi:hypothetical protein
MSLVRQKTARRDDAVPEGFEQAVVISRDVMAVWRAEEAKDWNRAMQTRRQRRFGAFHIPKFEEA